MTHANRNQLWSRALIEELVRSGVEVVCVAPGSRSTPLVLACDERPELELIPHLDERSAAFFALGGGKATGRPTAVVTTSGTAAANLFPAVIEASQSEIPLLLLTADRPPHLRGADGNQTIDQVRLFGGHVREFFEVEPPRVDDRSLRHLRGVAARAVARAVGAPAGPVHLNLPFEKPLEPTHVPGEVPDDFARRHPRAAEGRAGSEPYVRITRSRSHAASADVEAVADLLAGATRGVLVAGPSSEPSRTGPAVRRLAAATGFPLLADPLSGARFRSEPPAPVVERYDLLLREPKIRDRLRPEVLIRTGTTPTSPGLVSFLEESLEARQVVVDDGHRFKDHLAVAQDYVRADPATFLDLLSAAVPEVASASWMRCWERLDEAVGRTVDRELGGNFFEAHVLRSVSESLPGGEPLFVSNSMPIRDLDSFARFRGGTLDVYGNRGASGIDGVVSTALGLAHGLGRPLTAVVGDLAFYHDMNGLLAARRGHGAVTFVVINNDGGGIFHMLPVREYDPPFSRLFATPHGLDFRHVADLYDVPYTRASTVRDLTLALSRGRRKGGSRIVEVRSDREENRRRHEEVVAAVRNALIDELGEEE